MKLCIPEDILKQHMAVLGKTGAGKSSALRHVVEHLLDKKKRVCVVDPKGDWWGLKKSADGREVGYGDVICFGDFKNPKATDIPINEHSGKQVAELIANGNRPCVIGFRGWMTGRMIRFWIDFASTLFTANSGELYLVGDEFHNFAPKGKILDPEAGKCLHWSNRLMSEGRGYGLVCLIASQRPQKVHNDTLTCCETLVAMRVIHKADRDAAQDWIEGCGDMAQGKEVLNSLAGMARGEAYVWSPEIGFGPQRVKFPMFETFDSFAPPQLQKKVSDSGWSAVDLDEVKDKLSAVIKEQQANDPTELKKRIRELEKQLSVPQKVAAPTVKEVSILTDEDRRLLNKVLDGGVETVLESFEKLQSKVSESVADMRKFLEPIRERLAKHWTPNGGKTITKARCVTMSPTQIKKIFEPLHKRPVEGEQIGGGMRRMMIALAQRGGLNKRQLGVRAGMSSTSGTFGTYMAKLRTSGWIEENGSGMELTKEGHEALGDYTPLPEGRDLYEYWRNDLGGGASRMLEALFESYPDALTKEELGERAGISHTSGTFGTYLAKLRTLELVTGKNELLATKEFFE